MLFPILGIIVGVTLLCLWLNGIGPEASKLFKITLFLIYLAALIFAAMGAGFGGWIIVMIGGLVCVLLPVWILEFVVLAIRRKKPHGGV